MPNGQAQASQVSLADEGITLIGARNGLELAIRRSPARSLGKVISRPDSSDLIAGVEVEQMQVPADGRGFVAGLGGCGSAGIAGRMVVHGEGHIRISTS